MRTFHACLATIILCLPGLPALAQSAGETIDVGGWKLSRVHNEDKSFKQCNAVYEYDDGSALGIAVNAETKVFVVMKDPAFKFTDGRTYKASFYVDKSAETPVDAVSINATTIVFPIVKDDAFMDAAAKGNALFIDIAGKTANNPLTGSGKAITQLGVCVVTAVKGS